MASENEFGTNVPHMGCNPIHETAAHPANSFLRFVKSDIEQTITDCFEQQVRKYPNRIAVKTHSDAITYSYINKLSNRIAHAVLEERGEGEEPVALLFEKGSSMVAAILAVLKAGKFYLALDRIYPAARNLYMLEDSRTRLIVTDTQNYQLSREWIDQGGSVINIDDLHDSSTENVAIKLSPDTLAYIFYTSGSTGPPKGVVDNHRNVLHNIMRYTNTLHICPEDRLTLLQSFCFSGSVSSLFGGLLNGAAVCLFNLHKKGMDNLADWLDSEGITIYHSVPSIFQHLMAKSARFPELRVIRLEGDQVSKQHVELYKKNFNADSILVNGLGATETGLTRQYFINPETEIPGSVVPIGYEVEDMEVLLLDDNGNEVETGKIGEIVVKSRYLAQGYWRKPDLTQAAFKEDPRDKSMRFYCTGDMGRFLPDGCLEYLGRKDFQVKIRGQWVEIEAIENALKHLVGIRDAVIVARDDRFGDKHLLAYLVPTKRPAPSIRSLRHTVEEQFPEHMVPSRFIIIDELPLTPNGKVDRKALPEPDIEHADIGEARVGPRTPMEELLARIWCEVLGLKQVGVHDNFFEMGGHSLRATKAVSGMEKITDKDLAPAILSQYPTIAGLAEYLSRENGRPQEAVQDFYTLYPIKTSGTGVPFFWIHSQMISFLPKYLGQDQPLYAIIAQGVDGKRVRYKTMKEITAHYLQEIRAVQPSGPYFLGGFCWGAKYAFDIAQQLHRSGEDVGLLFVVEPSLSPAPSNQTFIDKLYHRLSKHRRNLERLSVSGKTWYVSRKLGFAQIVYEAHLLTGRPMSPSLSVDYALHVIDKASRNYVQETYAREIVLIQAEESIHSVDADWSNLAEGGINVHVAQGAQHMDLLHEPGAKTWAEWLNTYLRKAQAKYSG
jgi:amino acid adenylation domain-containing protein